MDWLYDKMNSLNMFACATALMRTGVNSVFERLTEPVAQSECTVHNILTNQNAFINELSPQYHTKQSFELFPITQPLVIHPSIDQEIWKVNTTREEVNKLWINSIDRYTSIETGKFCLMKRT